VARYEYDPFGNTLSKSGALADANTYRFSSQEYHQNSGLLLYLYRSYDPNLQRFVNQDPIEELGGINLYGFVDNDPLGRIDPLGLGWLDTPTWMDLNGIPHYGTPPSEQPPENKLSNTSLLAEYGAGMDNNFNGVGMEDLTRQVTAAVGKGAAEACMTICPVGGAARLGTAAKGVRTAETVAADAAKLKKIEECAKLAKKYKSLLEAAKRKYPKLAERFHDHHITPKYLGGDPKGPTVRLNAAYHQEITNAFRREWPYGQGMPDAQELLRILDKVYSQFPLPPP